MKRTFQLLLCVLVACSSLLPASAQSSPVAATSSVETGSTILSQKYLEIAQLIKQITTSEAIQNNPDSLSSYLKSIQDSLSTLASNPSVSPRSSASRRNEYDTTAIAKINNAAEATILNNPEFASFARTLSALREQSLRTQPLPLPYIAKTISPKLKLTNARKQTRFSSPDTEGEEEEEYTSSGTDDSSFIAYAFLTLIALIFVCLGAYFWDQARAKKKREEEERINRARRLINDYLERINRQIAIIVENYGIGGNPAAIDDAKRTIQILTENIREQEQITQEHTEIPEIPPPPQAQPNEYGIVGDPILCTEMSPYIPALLAPRRYVPRDARDTRGDGTYTLVVHGATADGEDLRFPLDKPVVSLGRMVEGGHADIALENVTNCISRMHAALSFVNLIDDPAGTPSYWMLNINQAVDTNLQRYAILQREGQDDQLIVCTAIHRNETVILTRTPEISITIE